MYQCKIICNAREDANSLILSVDLKMAGYKLLIPSSLLRKKAFIRDVDPKYSPKEIIDRLDQSSKDIITSARRRTNKDGSLTDTIEFTLATHEIPRFVFARGFECALTPVIPAPRRCFKCQRFRHVADHCRSSKATCEYCSGHHRTETCPNGLRSAHCSNCFGDHIASSRDCPMYKYEFEIMRHCFWNNCSFREAEVNLTVRGITRPQVVSGVGSGRSHPSPLAADVDVDADVSHLDSLGSTGSGVPSIVTAAKSLLSFSRSYDSQLDKIINNSALQVYESSALSPPASDTGGIVN